MVTLGLVGVVGYVLMARQLRQSQVADYAREQRADVRGFEVIGRRHGATLAATVAAIDARLDGIALRPGTLETLLIDPNSVVVASGNVDDLVGRRDSDAQIAAALDHGTSYAGRHSNIHSDPRDFEYVTPVDLPGGRYAIAVGYDHRVLDANLRDVRRTLDLIGLLALIGGAGVFYLVGGRSLLRSHRIALQRATRDGLTDLPNHRAFQDEFPRAVAAAARHQEPLALIVFDVNDFKFLNDTHGHPHGDAVLCRVADTLRSGRVEDRPYRIGGDEFAMLLPHTDGAGASTIAARLRRGLDDAEVVVSIGVSDLRAGQSAQDLRAEADAALYEVKRRGGARVAHFDEIRDQVVITTSARTDQVRRLIDEARLSTVYQPIWDLESERLLSPQTLDLDAAGSEWLLNLVKHAGLAPDQIVIEVTERFGARTDSVIACLRHLRAAGFQLALDDVGTGNSGLEMLQKVSADFVKIDQSIIASAATDRSARAVLMAMATYAKQTGSYVIAEGIEDVETLDFLHAIDEHTDRPQRIIQGGQGFGLGYPTPGGATDHTPGLLERPVDARPA
jgi:diguanylate cyclase (GGDEF)-like protein